MLKDLEGIEKRRGSVAEDTEINKPKRACADNDKNETQRNISVLLTATVDHCAVYSTKLAEIS